MAMVHAKRRARRVSKRRLLADVEIERRLRDLDGRDAHGIERLQAGHDLACRKRLDLKLVVGGLRDIFRKGLRRAVDGIERLRKARRQTPLDLGHRLRDRRCRNQRRRAGHGAAFEKRTAFHDVITPSDCNSIGHRFRVPARRHKDLSQTPGRCQSSLRLTPPKALSLGHRAYVRQRGLRYPSSKVVTPNTRSNRNGGTAPVYMRAVSNTGARPRSCANATASRLMLGTSRKISPPPTRASKADRTASALARSSATNGRSCSPSRTDGSRPSRQGRRRGQARSRHARGSRSRLPGMRCAEPETPSRHTPPHSPMGRRRAGRYSPAAHPEPRRCRRNGRCAYANSNPDFL